MDDKRREIDWSGAQVSEGSATLPLTADAPKAWTERFAGVVALLAQKGSAGWGEVEVGKKAVKVAELQPGAEDDLRHFIESVVTQVNSELTDEPGEKGSQATRDAVDPQAAQDAESAEQLRSYASEQRD